MTQPSTPQANDTRQDDDGFEQSIIEVLAKYREDREAARVEPDAPDACEQCHEFRGRHCSVCRKVLCGRKCHVEYRNHGGKVPYVLTDAITGAVVPMELEKGWMAVERRCPTCGNSQGANRENGKPVCLACRAGWSNHHPATDEEMEVWKSWHGTLVLRLELSEHLRRQIDSSFRPAHRETGTVTVKPALAKRALEAVGLVSGRSVRKGGAR